MALFSKQNKEVFTNPLNLDHPILGQVLGICSALAVTSQLKPAIVMGLAVTVITAFANGYGIGRYKLIELINSGEADLFFESRRKQK